VDVTGSRYNLISHFSVSDDETSVSYKEKSIRSTVCVIIQSQARTLTSETLVFT
jgi:hypothetical protein